MIACYEIAKRPFAETVVVYPKDFLQLSIVFEDSWPAFTL